MPNSLNPYTYEIHSTHDAHTPEDINTFIEQAQLAQSYWGELSIAERAEYLKTLKSLLEAEKETLAKISVEEMGMLYKSALADINKVIGNINFHCQDAEKLLEPEQHDNAQIVYEPLGTILMITPWNFPFNQALRNSIPQLIAGNTIILKHAGNLPRVSLALQDLVDRAGFPTGVFRSIIYSGRKTGELIKHPVIKGVGITSGESAGRSVGQLAGEYLKPCVLELGGNDALVILNTADIDKATDLAIKGRLSNMGQKCNSSKRFIVDASIYGAFLESLKTKFEKQVLGDPFDSETTIGPLATKESVEEIDLIVKTAKQYGATILTGGEKKSLGNQDGIYNFYAPTILTNVDQDNPVYDQEIFGPVVTVHKANDKDHAIEIVNSSRFGLGCSIIGDDKSDTDYVARRVNVGNVAIGSIVTSHAHLPYGGIGDSGIGKELGKSGLTAFLNEKVIVA